MAVLAAAQLLDELMGRNRNINPNEKTQKLNWEDVQYCKYYMVKFCPHDLFVNTRADLGTCPRIHDDEVKDLYEKAEPGYKKTFYQDEFLRFCQNMISDVERKIQKGKQRLELMNTKLEMPALSAAQTERNQQQVAALVERVGALEAEAEQAGIKGDVEGAQGLMKLCDQLKEEKEQLQKQYENSHWSATVELAQAQEKQMEVCTVCGAFLIVGDAQQRIDDHLMGKQHVGYSRLKDAFDEITKEREKQRDEKERKRKEDYDREKERDRERRAGGLGSNVEKDRRSHKSDKERSDKEKGDKEKGDKDKSDKDRSERDRGSRSHRSGSSRDEKRSRHGDEKDRRTREEGRSRGEDRRSRGHEERGLGSRDRSRDRDSRRRRSRSRGR